MHYRFILLVILLVLPLPRPAMAEGYEKELLARINDYRTVNGLKPLSPRLSYDDLALAHSRDMRSTGRMSHDGFEKRFRSAVAGGAHGCVENVGWNYATPEGMFDGWQHSPGHDKNMLDPQITEAGIAKYGPYITFFACY